MQDDFVFYLDNDKDIQKDVELPDNTGEYAPAVGLTGIVAFVSATKGGAAINPALDNLALVERTNMPGRYWVTIDASAINTHLTAYEDESVFVCTQFPGNFRVWDEYKVRAHRS
jgi:hypothetical protein